MKYKIVKYFRKADKPPQTIEKNLSLNEAKSYCQREDTKKEGKWFCGFTAQ